MDDNERKVKIQELIELRQQLLEKDNIDNVNEENQGNERGKVKVKSNGKFTSTGEYPEPLTPVNNPFDKAGMINVITLSIITFVFEP